MPENPPHLLQLLGRRGESDALAYLESRGFKLVERNYRTRFGELDLITISPTGGLVFVEVKARMRSEVGSPLEQIDQCKVSHLTKAIALYADHHQCQEKQSRLDAIGIRYEISPGDQDDLKMVDLEHVSDLTGW